jgi:hypothetical protein
MGRGLSLEQDLRLLINNPKYSDIEILCRNDEEKLYACRAILAARSEVFDSLLYNGMKESYEKQISFPEINASGMKIILEYTYTGSIKEESLNKDNIVEAFHAADYFLLLELRSFIMKTAVKNINYIENYSPELAADIMPLSDNNILLNFLIEKVATEPLNTIEFGRLSISALQYLLSYTHGKEKLFATPEYEVFRYSAILAAKQVSNGAYKTIMKQLPTLEHLGNSIKVGNKAITNHQKIAKELEPLVKFIDFRRIEVQILANIVEPLKIVKSEIIICAYQYIIMTNHSDLNAIRGIPIYILNESELVWDKSACGSEVIIEDNGKIARTQAVYKYDSVRTQMILDKNYTFVWNVIIERYCEYAYVGVCASENFNYDHSAGSQNTGWVLGPDGYCWNFGSKRYYCPKFKEGAKITIHLDMNKRTLAFTVNGTKYPELKWNKLPSKLYPVVSLCRFSRIRICSYQNV